MQTSRKNKKSASNENIKFKLHQLNWLEYVAIGLSLWFLFYPNPYELLLIALLLLPLVGMFLNGLHQPSIASLVEIDRAAKNEYDVADFIDIPAWVILLRTLLDFETDSYVTVILTGTVAFVAICLFLFITHKQISDSNKDKWWIYSSVIFSLFIYSYSSVVAVNCVFDTSEPKVYDTEIIDKYISRGRRGSRNYYVKVKPWSHHYDVESISVTTKEYEQYQLYDKVKIEYKEGLLGIPWYYLD